MAGSYPEIPVRPEPAFWCAQRTYFCPNQFGDPALPIGFVDMTTLARLPAEQLIHDWEMRPDPRVPLRDERSRGVFPVAVARAVTRRFETAVGSVLAVDAVDVAVAPHQLTVIAGPSGSGKSTLLSLLACIDRPDSGSVHIMSTNVTSLSRSRRRRLRRERIGIVLPQPSDNLLERLDAMGNLTWSARQRSAATGRDGPDPVGLLDSVGLGGAGRKRVRELSRGEQQRLAIACALVGDPALVVADEPTASLDRASAAQVVEALRAAGDRGVTLVVAGHDRRVIEVGDTVVELDHGRRVG